MKALVAILWSPGKYIIMVKRMRSGVHQISPCVIIVDDDVDAADLYGIWLREAGHRVSIVSDAQRALILAPILRPSVVVTDIGLPGIDGIELVSRLRQLTELEDCRYVAVTAYKEASLAGRCRAAGFSDFLEKPFSAPTLINGVFAAARAGSRASDR